VLAGRKIVGWTGKKARPIIRLANRNEKSRDQIRRMIVLILRMGEKMNGLSVLITGSSSGIGRETAYRFAREGATVILTYCRGRTRGERAEERCRRLGAKDTLLLHLDVTDERSVAAARGRVARKFGRIDFLINNAGVLFLLPLRKQTRSQIERQLRTNLEGLVRMAHVFLPIVRKGIVNIASAAGEEAYEEMSTYCGSKFGVRGFTQALRLEHKRLRIGCVNPDQTATRLSGYVGRPPSEVAEVIYRTVTGAAKMSPLGDVDVWDIVP
jgi:NAD(P)-dependent dehydrogenase (short-subunit alcohol dehydrogenase family)